jgi:hypothetical protein
MVQLKVHQKEPMRVNEKDRVRALLKGIKMSLTHSACSFIIDKSSELTYLKVIPKEVMKG